MRDWQKGFLRPAVRNVNEDAGCGKGIEEKGMARLLNVVKKGKHRKTNINIHIEVLQHIFLFLPLLRSR
ncbi:hypothetical protein ZHAS_00009930 [Anopheles sinensis]|uniref:Uncharacterized protein n=1 Tax=Anopheles sinensis TaxID=74873 RepID=A0A084VWA0_ANOSI|nr:hypothetical protein ZHAS_00009930 [Anopheles sinensis]